MGEFSLKYSIASSGETIARIKNLFFWTNVYQKIAILAILGAVLPHILIHNDEIWHEGANLGFPQAKFCI